MQEVGVYPNTRPQRKVSTFVANVRTNRARKCRLELHPLPRGTVCACADYDAPTTSHNLDNKGLLGRNRRPEKEERGGEVVAYNSLEDWLPELSLLIVKVKLNSRWWLEASVHRPSDRSVVWYTIFVTVVFISFVEKRFFHTQKLGNTKDRMREGRRFTKYNQYQPQNP